MKRALQVAGVLLLFGVAKMPLEQGMTRDLRQRRLLEEPLRLGVGEDLGQAGLAASLGGLRGLAACMFQLRAHVEFTRVNWAKVDSLYKLVTRLQPREARYWEEAAWHMAYNAASYYLYNMELKPSLRGQLYHDHVKRGAAILEEGLKFLPDSPRLWQKLAEVHWARTKEYKLAGDAYWNSFTHGGLNFTERFAAYAWAQSNDRASWKKGYAILKRLYDAGKATPGLIEYLQMIERHLDLPITQPAATGSAAGSMPKPHGRPTR